MNKFVILLKLSLVFYFPQTTHAQSVDTEFDASIRTPAYQSSGPVIMIDEAHYNLSNDDTYGPLFKLLKADGYYLKYNSSKLSSNILKGADVMVIINPRGGRYMDKEQSVFLKEEGAILTNWIKNGGSLLLIIDNFYSVAASRNLLTTLKVQVSGGTVTDSKNYDRASMRRENLVFSRDNNLLPDHTIINGRHSDERVSTIHSFSGTSLIVNPIATNLLRLSEFAKECPPDSVWTSGKGLFKQTYVRFVDPVSVKDHSQGIAIELGKGRIVVLGDGTMLTALVLEGKKQGMNTGTNHNKQFALNIFHWLSRIL
jgi:hypothetical protein